jgi:fatty-acyl-CoA synthase
MAQMLRDAPRFRPAGLKGLRALFTGGAPNPRSDILSWLEDGIPMVDGYGMT